MKLQLPQQRKHQSRVILLRHAMRDAIPHGEIGNDLPITQEGCLAAKSLGFSLKNVPFVSIVTSPIKRCIQTAEYIKQGLQQDIPIIYSKILGDPGPFVNNPFLAGPLFLESGTHAVYNALMRGSRLPGMNSFNKGICQFLTYLNRNSQPLQLMVSHDFLVATLAAFFFDQTCLEKIWPDFLEAFIIDYDPREFTCSYRNMSTSTTWKKILN